MAFLFIIMIFLSGSIISCSTQKSATKMKMQENNVMNVNQDSSDPMIKEVDELLTVAATMQKAGSKEDFMNKLVDGKRFSFKQNVFFPSALAVDFKNKRVTLPVYKGIRPSGNPTFYIITEAADFKVAKMHLSYLMDGERPEASK